MSKVRLTGATSGYTEITAPAVAGNNTVTLPSSNGAANQLLKNGATAGSLEFASNVRIDSSGNFLVGTTSAVSVNGINAGLELHALTSTNGASASIARFNNDAAGPQLNFGKSRSGTLSPGTVVQNNDTIGEISFCGDDGTDMTSRGANIACQVDGTPGANDMPGRLIFGTATDGAAAPTERLRITSDGNVNIGTAGETITPASNSASGVGLSITNNGGILSKTTQAIGSVFFEQNIISYTSGTAVYQRFRTGGGVIGSITTTNGTSTAYNTSSDYRLKENITPLDGAIARLNQLPVHRFNFIANPDTVVDGFIAHEAAEVVPEAVTGTKDAVDDEGNPEYQGIDQSKLVPLLTAALQEALQQIEALTARVAALEAN